MAITYKGPFVCRICGEKKCVPIVRLEGVHSRVHGYYCSGCSVQFHNPAVFSIHRLGDEPEPPKKPEDRPQAS